MTGASSGIGLATVRALTQEGARVLLVARSSEPLERALAELVSNGAEAATLAADVTDPDAPEAIAAATRQHFGEAEVLVNNAGTSANRPIAELTDGEWNDQWELNVMASMRLIRRLAPSMAERGWGRIVNVCSSSGKRPSASNAAYSVAKAAQLSLSRIFADAYAASGVLVNAVAPGPVETPLWMAPGGLAEQSAARAGISREEALAKARARLPIGRFGTEDEIAAVIAFLCSERASDVVGAAWSVDGGAVPLFI
ncbi:MAG: SDR family oxidoreductase [Thermoleophilaceae bacterium]